MQLCLSQNIGIDVAEPLGKLHIQLNSTTANPQLRLTETGYDYSRIKLENTAHTSSFWDIAGKADSTTSSAKLNFYFSNGASSGDRMTILGNGNVGINNSNPISKFEIRSIGDGNELLRFTTDRPWVFKQTDSGADTRLTLQSTVDSKIFDIVSADGNNKVAEFKVRNINPEIHMLTSNGRLGIGVLASDNKVRILGESNSTSHVLSVSTGYNGYTNVRAIEGFSLPQTGRGVGGHFVGGFRGVQAKAEGSASNDLCIGLEGSAYGSNGTRIGVFGRGVGGDTNWAGYFAEGNVYVTNELRIGSGAIDGASGYKVAIDGKMIAEEVRVQSSSAWPDYVFEESYNLTSLENLEEQITQLGHLPGVPSAREVSEEGILLGDMQKILLEKIEELTLYTIDLQKQVDTLTKQLDSIKSDK